MEEQRLEGCPNVGVTPVFAENVSGVGDTRNVSKVDVPSGNGFTHEVERKHIVAFVELGVDLSAAFDNGLIIAKDIALVVHRDSKVAQCVT